MKTRLRTTLGIIVAACGLTVFTCKATVDEIDFSGVAALAERLGGEALSSKVFFEEWTDQCVEQAQIVPGSGSFTIKATSVHAASLALGVYLRDIAKGHISWCGNRIPSEWPLPTDTRTVAPAQPCTIAYNYCTLSYTMAFWGQADWQKEIDRLALSGYNMALVTAGIQEVWDKTLDDMGYTQDQKDKYITDDAVQAWWLMGNLQGLSCGGGVTKEQIARDGALGKWIVPAMRKVGIEPVLQGFVGLIPSTTTTIQLADKLGLDASKSEDVRIFVNGYYVASQKNPDVLDPTCKAFELFHDAWMKNMKTVYGLEETGFSAYPKYLGGDLFHESSPPGSMTTEQKVNCAKFVQSYQQKAFPGVTWILQSWQGSPDQNLRNGLDPKYTLIEYLDQTMSATGAREGSYYNYYDNCYLPWVWVEVMNFGGNTGMHGAFRRFRNMGNIVSPGSTAAANFRGYGSLSEGFETNPSSYDMFAGTFTQTTADEQNISDAELVSWLENYRLRRYGYTDDDLKEAHRICASSVWDCARDQQGTIESVLCAFPSYSIGSVSAWGPTSGTPHERTVLVEAAKHFLAAAKRKPELLDLETFRYDFVEIFQQILADRAREIHSDCATVKARRAEFRKILELADDILMCSDDWRLDKKEARTVEKAPDTGVAGYRRMITTWTPGSRGQNQLSQYAHRSYAGLMKNYYAKKWDAFFKVTEGEMTSGQYQTLCANLDVNFPTMKLTYEAAKNPVAVAESILNLLEPPAYTWNGAAGDNKWESANWTDNTGATVAWKEETDAILSGNGLILTSEGDVVAGAITLGECALTSNESVVIANNEVTVFSNLDIATLYNNAISGMMGGSGRFVNADGSQRTAKALTCYKSALSDGSFTIQFQCTDDDFAKSSMVRFTQSGADIKAVVIARGSASGGTPGSSDLSGTTSDLDAYSVCKVTVALPSSIIFDGAIIAADGVTVDKGALTIRNAAAAGSDFSLNGGTLTIDTKDGSEVTVTGIRNEGVGASLVLATGTAESQSTVTIREINGNVTIVGAEDALNAGSPCRVKLAHSSLAKSISYVGPNGEAQPVKVGTDGYLKTAIGTLAYTGEIPTEETKTDWKNVEQVDLLAGAYSSGLNLGSAITATGNGVTVSIDGKTVTLTIKEDGCVYIKADASGVANLVITPGVAQVTETKTNYADLQSAIDAAKNTTSKAVSIYADATYGTDCGIKDGVVVTVEDGVTLTAMTRDGISWRDVTATFNVKGTLDIGAHRWTILGPNVRFNMYTGAKFLGSGDGYSGNAAFDMKANNTGIHVLKGTGAVTEIKGVIGLSNNATIEVDDGATVSVDAISNGNGGNSEPTLTKSGAGTLVFNGILSGGQKIVLEAGTVAKELSEGASFTMTVKGGTPDITSANPDYKITEAANAETKVVTFTSIAKRYMFRVTKPGVISVNKDGVNYETFEEAIAAAKASLAANPDKAVKLWVVETSLRPQAEPIVAAYCEANGKTPAYTFFGDGNGVQINGWETEVTTVDPTDPTDPVGPEEPTGPRKIYYPLDAT